MVTAALVGVVFGLLLVIERSSASFSAGTSATGQVTSGTVSVTDDDAGVALFDVSGLQPGSTGTRCIAVSYGGNLAADVRLFVSTTAGALAEAVLLTIEEGTGGTGVSCASFSGSTVWTGSLDALAATAVDFASGLGTFAPTGSGQVRSYRFTYTLDPAVDPGLAGTSASSVFVWEARH